MKKIKLSENSHQTNAIKVFVLSVTLTTLLLSCNQNQTKKEEKQSVATEQENIEQEKSVSLSVEPNVFKLSEIPDKITVTITNNTNDTISTGLHYQIEYYENNEWKQVSPKDMVFHDLGWQLKPTESENFETQLYKNQINYTAGKYRIVKYYLKSDYQKTKTNFDVYAEFNIE